jgi:hypothetical protein
MAFSGNFVCDSFKTELFEGVHTFGVGGDQFKIALYDNNASFNASTTAYTTANEVAATGTYAAGGGNLTSLPLDHFKQHGAGGLFGYFVYGCDV